MKIMRNLAATLMVISGLFAASAAIAGTETNVSSGLTAKGPGLAPHRSYNLSCRSSHERATDLDYVQAYPVLTR